jgi:cytochrome d ubiquinol oxidase subunit I
VYAVGWLRGRRDRYHRLGFLVPFTVAAIVTPVQMALGDGLARSVFQQQPTKFAAIEIVWKTGSHQSEYLYGRLQPDGTVSGGIRIPGLDSFLAGFSRDTVVSGLSEVPADQRATPQQATIAHWAFDTMVGIGTALLLLGLWFGVVAWRRRSLPTSRWFWRAGAAAGVAAVVALECGWIVTEVGRQPWVVTGFLRTKDAVTGADNLWLTFSLILLLYTVLGVGTVVALRALAARWRRGEEDESEVPYGPVGEAS